MKKLLNKTFIMTVCVTLLSAALITGCGSSSDDSPAQDPVITEEPSVVEDGADIAETSWRFEEYIYSFYSDNTMIAYDEDYEESVSGTYTWDGYEGEVSLEGFTAQIYMADEELAMEGEDGETYYLAEDDHRDKSDYDISDSGSGDEDDDSSDEIDWNGVYINADGSYITIEEYDGPDDDTFWFYLNEEGTEAWQNLWNFEVNIREDNRLEAELDGEINFWLRDNAIYVEFSDPDYAEFEGLYELSE